MIFHTIPEYIHSKHSHAHKLTLAPTLTNSCAHQLTTQGLVTTRSAFQGPSSNSRHLLDEQQNRLLQRRSHDVEQQQHQQPYLGQHSEEMMGGNRNFPPPSMKGKDDSLPASKMGGNSLPIGGKGTPLSRLPSTKATPRASSNAPAKERSIPEYQQQRDPASLPRRR